VRTVALHDENGLVVPSGDANALAAALNALLGDPARRRRMGENGRAQVEAKYAWARIGAALADVYREVARG